MKTKNKIITSLVAISVLILPITANATTYGQDKQAVQQKAREGFYNLVTNPTKVVSYANKNCEGAAKTYFTEFYNIPGTESFHEPYSNSVRLEANKTYMKRYNPNIISSKDSYTTENYKQLDPTHWSAFISVKRINKLNNGISLIITYESNMKLHKIAPNNWKIYFIDAKGAPEKIKQI